MSETLKAIRKRYPRYAEVSDEELAIRIGERFPVYLERDAGLREEFETAKASAADRRKRMAEAEENAAEPYQEPPSTVAKAGYAFLGGLASAVADPVMGAADIASRVPGLSWTPGGRSLQTAAQLAEPLSEAGLGASTVAEVTPGNQIASEIAGTIGSGVGSAAYSLVPGVGAIAGPVAAGLQSYESTRRDAETALRQAGMSPEEARAKSFSIATKAGLITGGVTAAFNRYGGKIFGKGVERTLGSGVRKVVAEDIRKGIGREVVRETLREIRGEAAEEAIDQALQSALVTWEYNPNLTFKEAALQTVKAGIYGGVAGGVVGGGGAALETTIRRREAIRDLQKPGARRRAGVEEAKPGATPPQLSGSKSVESGSVETPIAPPVIPGAETPIDQPSTSHEIEPAPGSGIQKRGPGTWVSYRMPDGTVGEMQVPDGANLEASQAYLMRAMPGAVIERIDVVPQEGGSSVVGGGTQEPSAELPPAGAPLEPATQPLAPPETPSEPGGVPIGGEAGAVQPGAIEPEPKLEPEPEPEPDLEAAQAEGAKGAETAESLIAPDAGGAPEADDDAARKARAAAELQAEEAWADQQPRPMSDFSAEAQVEAGSPRESLVALVLSIGIKPPGPGDFYAAEYDDFNRAVKEKEFKGHQRIQLGRMVRKGGLHLDQLMAALKDEGFHWESPEEFWQELFDELRHGAKVFLRPEEKQFYFDEVSSKRVGRGATKNKGRRMTADELNAGDQFDIGNRTMVVLKVHPDGEVQLRQESGRDLWGTVYLRAGQVFYPDRKSFHWAGEEKPSFSLGGRAKPATVEVGIHGFEGLRWVKAEVQSESGKMLRVRWLEDNMRGKAGSESTVPKGAVRPEAEPETAERGARSEEDQEVQLNPESDQLSRSVGSAVLGSATTPDPRSALPVPSSDEDASISPDDQAVQESEAIGQEKAVAAVREALGMKPWRGLPSWLQIVFSPGWLHSSGRQIRGAVSRAGRVIINTAAIRDAKTVAKVLREELLHKVWRDPKMQEAWNRIAALMGKARVEKARKEGYAAGEEAAEEGTIDEVMDLASQLPEGTIQRFVNTLVRALRRVGLGEWAGAVFGTDALTAADAATLIARGYSLANRPEPSETVRDAVQTEGKGEADQHGQESRQSLGGRARKGRQGRPDPAQLSLALSLFPAPEGGTRRAGVGPVLRPEGEPGVVAGVDALRGTAEAGRALAPGSVPRGTPGVTRSAILAGLAIGPVNPTGMSAATPEDRHAIAALFRNPYFETFQWYFVKDGKVIHTVSLTARVPDTVDFWGPTFTEGEFNALVRGLKPDSYFWSHNHPSGIPTPSDADIIATRVRTIEIKKVHWRLKFLGHVVVNHEHYSVIRRLQNGEVAWDTFIAPDGDDRFKNTAETRLRGAAYVGGPTDVAAVAKQYHTAETHVTVLLTTVRNTLRAVVEMPVPTPGVELDAWVAELRAVAVAHGAVNGAAYYTGPDPERKIQEALREAVSSGALVDAVTDIAPDGIRVNLRAGLVPLPGFRLAPAYRKQNQAAQQAAPGDEGIRYSLGGGRTTRPDESTTTEPATEPAPGIPGNADPGRASERLARGAAGRAIRAIRGGAPPNSGSGSAYRLPAEGAPTDWIGGPVEQDSIRDAEEKRLVEWARSEGKILPASTVPSPPDFGGEEHHVWRDRATNRVWKATKGRSGYQYGQTPDGSGSAGSYLERIELANEAWSDDIRLEGVIEAEEDPFMGGLGHPRIVISQPFVEGPEPRQSEINDFLRRAGFWPLRGLRGLTPILELAWFHPEKGILISDVHPGNFIWHRELKVPVPIDTMLMRPARWVQDDLRNLLAREEQEALRRDPYAATPLEVTPVTDTEPPGTTATPVPPEAMSPGHAAAVNEAWGRDPIPPEGDTERYSLGGPSAEPQVTPEQADEAVESGVPPPDLARRIEKFYPGRKLNKGDWRRLIARAALMPSVRDLRRLALLGESSRRWYQQAKAVFQAAVPEADLWRWTAVVAATSPNKGVPANLDIALGVWERWQAAGRPTDPAALVDLLWAFRNRDGTPTGAAEGNRPTKGRGVSRDSSRPIYLEADLANTVAALAAQTPDQAYAGMSDASPKVKPFFRALLGYLDAVVNDSWLARIYGISKKQMRNPLNNLLATATVRDVARSLGWEPAEVQAALWAVARVVGNRIKAALRAGTSNRPRLSRILREPITDAMLNPGDDLATMLVEGYTTKSGTYYDFPERARRLGFDVGTARAVRSREAGGSGVRGSGPEVGDNARRALGQPASLAFGRRVESGYLLDEKGQKVQDPLRYSLGGLNPVDRGPSGNPAAPSIVAATLADQASLEREMARQNKFGEVTTPFLSELCYVGAVIWEELGGQPRFSAWARGMTALYGPAARPFLRRAWERIDPIRYSLGAALPPESVADLGRIRAIAAQSEAARLASNEPLPVYDVNKQAKFGMSFWRPSSLISYFGSPALLRKKQLLDLRTAYQAAAVKNQAEALMEQVQDSFFGKGATGLRKWFRQFMPKEEMHDFLRHALPIAAHLNILGGSEGAWLFEGFEMRAGFLPESEAKKAGAVTGGTHVVQRIGVVDPTAGRLETLRVGEFITLDDGRKGYQLLREMPQERQRALYRWACDQWPQFQWFLDTWVDPRLADTRITLAGVEVPAFNRFALERLYREGDPLFQGRLGYTPDVSVGVGIIGMAQQFLKERKLNIKAGVTSPGRKYETGAAREAGNVMDLLSGFNTRVMQGLQEKVRREWMGDILEASHDKPKEGTPAGWIELENAMAQVWNAFKILRRFDDPLNFPQTTERLRDDESPEFQKFFGELMNLRKANPEKIVPKPLVDALIGEMSQVASTAMAARVARWWGRQWKALLLLMPDTYMANRTDNYLRLLMQSYRQVILAAIRGGDALAFREARKLAWTSMVNILPGVRAFAGWVRPGLFEAVLDTVLPDELFTGATQLADLAVYQDNVQAEIESLRAQGRRGAALLKAASEIGTIGLEAVGYGNLDIRAKQQFAYAVLLAKAEHEAHRQNLAGEQARAFVEQWMKAPPEASLRRAVEGANRALLNYGDTAAVVTRFARQPWSNLFFAFPVFRYHFVGRELDRATSGFRALFKLATGNKTLTRDEWTGAMADLISYVTLPVMGYGLTEVIGALADSLLGGLDDEEPDDIRNVIGSSIRIETDPETGEPRRKPLPRELVTANRLNVTQMLDNMGLPADASEDDIWWSFKNYPIVRSTAILHQAVADTRKFGPGQGMLTLSQSFADLLSSLTGAGQAVKVPLRFTAEWNASRTGERVVPSFFDPYGASVPLDAYLTLQALNLVPGNRQADEMIKWLDPTPRRVTRSKSLDYDPGIVEALQAGGWTGLADRLARGVATGSFASPLLPQGEVDKKGGVVVRPREHGLTERVASILGQNVKEIPRSEYEAALEEE